MNFLQWEVPLIFVFFSFGFLVKAKQGTMFCYISVSRGFNGFLSQFRFTWSIAFSPSNVLETSTIIPVLGQKVTFHLFQDTSSPIGRLCEETTGREESRLLSLYQSTFCRQQGCDDGGVIDFGYGLNVEVMLSVCQCWFMFFGVKRLCFG